MRVKENVNGVTIFLTEEEKIQLRDVCNHYYETSYSGAEEDEITETEDFAEELSNIL